ncbi:cyclin-like protein [Tupanvirus soda lake]|uniref:Cyclin-like protein n=2 Tax=Tupanvirus TaxID=2094720 RepID=A0A6N1NM19_9VIRU|nr:cyclin-like protein [Tupanvirus soda lake]QKU35544.1 cyclin-like protein [Tupanvirus soda lake]
MEHQRLTYKERHENLFKKYIQDFCEKVQLPHELSDKIFNTYTKINDICLQNRKVFRGATRVGIIGLCVLSECKNAGINICPAVVSKNLGIHESNIHRAYYHIRTVIPNINEYINYEAKNKEFINACYSRVSVNFAERAAHKLNMPEKYIQTTIDLAKYLSGNESLNSSNSPNHIASSALLAISEKYGLQYKAFEIANIFKMSDSLVKIKYELMLPIVSHFFDIKAIEK